MGCGTSSSSRDNVINVQAMKESNMSNVANRGKDIVYKHDIFTKGNFIGVFSGIILSIDIVSNVFVFLDKSDLKRCSLVCKTWSFIVAEKAVIIDLKRYSDSLDDRMG